MNKRTFAAIAVLAILLIPVLFSQERRGEGPFRGPGFGRGPGGPGGMPMANVMLLGMPEVRREIGLPESLQKPIDELLGDVQQQFQAAFQSIDFREVFNLSEAEREKQFAAMRAKTDEVTASADEKLAKLLDDKQLARLNQLRVQREGIGALNRPDIAKQLGLKEEQLQKIREIAANQFGPFVPPEVRDRNLADAVAVLTDDQRKKWSDLKGKDFSFPEPQFGGPGGPGRGPGGMGGPGGPMGPERKLVKQFDKDEDKRLNNDERKAARDFVKQTGGGRGGMFGGPGGRGGPPGGPPLGGPGGGPGGPPGGPGFPGGPPGGFGRNEEPAKPGPRVSPDDVKSAGDAPLYDSETLRTLFLQFESDDWEAELADFNNTDVEVPATLIVDGKTYPNVGVHFRGASSFFGVRAGHKRSLNISLDFVDPQQRLYGYKTLNLLNSHEDPTFLHTVLYLDIARRYTPAPKANFVKLVINGESWGIYPNAQQFNKEFLAENYPDSKGARWKVQGSPQGRGGLEYLGDNVEPYKAIYTLKSGESNKAWKDLVRFCKTLNETPVEELESALEPILDIESALWFLALENALINSDGYWTRASDYCIYRDEKGKFHIIPHDANETFAPAMGPGMGGPGGPGGRPGGPGGFPGGPFGPPPGGPSGRPEGPEGRPGEGARPDDRRGTEGRPGQARPGEGRPGEGRPGEGGRPDDRRGGPRPQNVDLDPLIGLTDRSKPLRSRLLAVPSLKARYLAHVRTLAEEALDWNKLGPAVARYEKLIAKEVEADTKKLTSFAAFQQTVSGKKDESNQDRRPRMGLREFAEQRRTFLLNHPEIKALPR